jgi:phosphatidylserine/phosphatidylglycerophosphate/cardiolipin synthase-like enzyme
MGKAAANGSPQAERVVVSVEQRRAAFLDAIDGARHRVALSMFRCTDFKVLDKLGEALERGVAVELLLTQRAKGWEKKIRELGKYLESMGARVHRYDLPNVKYHAKYMVVDGQTALVASLNLTRKCFEKTSDFVLITQDPQVVGSLGELFERDREAPGSAVPAQMSSRLIIGPESARARFRALIASARQSLKIVDHKITDPEMLALLAARQSEGVKVDVYAKGAFDGLKSHGKMMIVDGERAALGSISLSPPSLGGRREVAIVTEEPACVRILDDFLAHWTGGHGALVGSGAAGAGGAADDDEDEEEDD